MTIQQAYRRLLAQLYEIYNDREGANIADWVIEYVTGQRKIDRIMYKNLPVTDEQTNQLENITGQLLQHRPVQYVLGEAWFAGMKFFVDENVLIPRPETEELVNWMIEDLKKNQQSIFNIQYSVLDIGTGSGCIAIALKRKLPQASIFALDVSAAALKVAQKNAKDQDVLIEFFQYDFLNESGWTEIRKFDVLVSNPPYVKQGEKRSMQKNVLEFEPHLALFVSDEDALIFYRKIALFGKFHLNQGGYIYVEINEMLGDAVAALFKDYGYDYVQMKKDLQGKDRMVKAMLP